MGLLFVDSFDHYAVADFSQKWTQRILSGNGDASTFSAGNGRRSTSSLRLATTSTNDTTDRFCIVLPASGATCVVGMAIRSNNAMSAFDTGTTDGTGSAVILAIRQGGTTHVWFRLNTSGTISAYRASTLLGTSTFALQEDVYAHWEFKVTINDTTGIVQLRKNGVLDSTLNLSSQDTKNTTSATWDEIAVGHIAIPSGGGAACSVDVDDLYVCDGSGSIRNDFLGDCRVDATLPTANGNSNMSTPSTGTDRFATVDETSANGDTDYNTLAAANDKDTLNFPTAPVASATFLGIQLSMQAKKTDAGTATLVGVTRVSGTDYDSTPQLGFGTTYSIVCAIFQQNPADSSDWESADYDAAEFGYKKAS